MSSSPPGTGTSVCEVTNITLQGFWLLLDEREYFVPFSDYPMFRDATVAQIHAVRRSGPGQIHWPDLDVDIELVALARPEAYPLLFQS
jgi:hypothetical protein